MLYDQGSNTMKNQNNLTTKYILLKNNLEENLRNFVTDICNEKDGRYKSWNHCYDYFQELFKKNNPDKDYAALILGFFLASWGMLRNSFLLNCTYTIHERAIDILLKHKPLLTKKIIEKENIEKFFKLKNELEDYYSGCKKKYDKNKEKNNEKITQVLISKIIMGVSGLVPAYDRYVVRALKERGICQTFNETSYADLLNLYQENKEQIQALQKEEKYKLYPPMKILDIYLWEEGRKLYEKEKKRK